MTVHYIGVPVLSQPTLSLSAAPDPRPIEWKSLESEILKLARCFHPGLGTTVFIPGQVEIITVAAIAVGEKGL